MRARPLELCLVEVGLKHHSLTADLSKKTWLQLSNEICCFFFLSTVGDVDDVFFSMADMDMSHSLSSLPPLGEPPTVDLDLSLNSNYSASPGESPSGNATVSLPSLT